MDVPFLKSPYDNVKMTIYFDIINLVGNYIVVNELKTHMKISHSKKQFNVHV
jgi:hypothetical protein